MNFQLVRAAENDLPFIMATERPEGYDAFVGHWDEARRSCGQNGKCADPDN
jgi:hypothetical protein